MKTSYTQHLITTHINSDPITNILKWILLFVAISCFSALIWGTYETYRQAPPLPDHFISPTGQTIFTQSDLIAGKAGFQRADLMDYGSLYGMGSYFGEDYTAKYLVRLGQITEDEMAHAQFNKSFAQLSDGDQFVIQRAMQQALQHIDLTNSVVTLPQSLANAVTKLCSEIAQQLLNNNFATGWTKAYSLNPQSAQQVGDFLIYSSLTTIARRPGQNISYTNNWPYEPLVGNAPSTETFTWTWISFCFVFFGFGAILFVYHRFLNEPDIAPKIPIFTGYEALLPSQKKVGQYFLVVALVFLLQIIAGTLLAHYYADRANFYGINIARFLPFNFLRDVHIQTPIVWIGLSWISAALFLAPLISGREAKRQG